MTPSNWSCSECCTLKEECCKYRTTDGHVTAHGKTFCREHAGEWVVYHPNAKPPSKGTLWEVLAADPRAQAVLAAKIRGTI